MKKSSPQLPRLGRAAAGLLLAIAFGWGLLPNASATLTHRYSFTADAGDSVGGANGTLMNGATVSGGAAQLSGAVASGPSCDYVELPPGLISNYTSVTFEFWVDVGMNGNWEELYGFGNQTSGGAGANMLMFCPHSGSAPNDFRMSYAQGAPGYTDEYVVNGVGILDNLGPLSVACVYDPPHNSMSLYTNGVLVGFMSPVTTGAKVFSLTNVANVNSWLGRSLYNGDASFAGSVDEFRIHNSALGPLEIAVDNAAGPDTVVTNIAVNSIAWNVTTNMTVGSRQDTTVTFNTASYGSFTLPGSTEATYATSDPTLATVSTGGRIFAMGVGTVTVSASYNNQTNSVVLTISNPALAHRYSFTSDVTDSVGGANGTLGGSATISGGAVVLPGGVASGDPTVSFVDLPNNLVTNLTAITVETWVTDLGSANWARIWDLGDSAGGEGVSNGGSRYMFLSLPSGSADLLGAIHVSDRAGGDQALEWGGGRPAVGKEAHVVWASDAAHHTGWLYVNGALVAVNTSMTLTPADIGPTVNDWIGRSQYNDPAFNGTIDEFRIWNGALSPLQVAINAAAGPDRVGPSDPGALQAVRLTANTAMVKRAQQQATVFGDFASVTNVNVTTLGATFASSDAAVLSVNASGLIYAVGAGTATVTANFNGKTDTKTITVTIPPVTLAHRWSFNETSGTSVADSVGGATGTLQNTAALGGGAVTLDGVSGYVVLPGHLIDGDNAVTFEAWVTVDPATPNNTSSRLFVLGSSPGANEVGMTARTGGNNTYVQYFGPPTVNVLRGGHLGLGQKLHVVAVFNPPVGTIDLFLNGSWQNTVTNLSFSLASITNAMSFLGVSLDTNNFSAATFDEFRIYNGALDLAGLRTSLAVGPDAVVTNPGAPVSLKLAADPTMVLGSRQLPHVQASFASVANVDLTQTDPVSYTSSDSTVVSVSLDGHLQAVGLGAATITATVSGKSDSKVVSVVPKQTMLAHRYSFTSDGSDSVGAQNGTLFGTATISGNAVALDGDPVNKNSYVELPSGLISSFDSVTLEAWVSLGSPLGTWARIFDFGNQSSGAGGISYAFLCPHTGTPGTRVVLSDGVTAASEAVLDFSAFTLDGFVGSVAVVYDPPSNTQYLYTNGVLVGSASLNGKHLSGLKDLHCWIGRSLYSGDSGLSGSIDEFRIYAGALSAAQVAADNAAGPDTVVLPPPAAAGPRLTLNLAGSNVVLSWPTSATGYRLQSSLKVGSGAAWSAAGAAPGVTNGLNQVAVPLSGSAAFYRLIH